MKNLLQLSELGTICGQSTWWSHRDPTGHSCPHPSAVLPRPLSPSLPPFLLSISFPGLNGLIRPSWEWPSFICVLFLLFPLRPRCLPEVVQSPGRAKWKLLCHFLYKGAYCDLTCCIREHPGWFTTLIKDNSNASAALLLHCTGLVCGREGFSVRAF